MRKPAYCICKNNGVDLLQDLALILCFCYIIQFRDLYFIKTIFQASSHLLWLYKPGLCRTWSATHDMTQVLSQIVFCLQSDQMARLVKIPGIVIAASAIKSKATSLTIQCRSCRNTLNNIAVKPGLEGYSLPRKCNT